jgi:hypothetical protein
MNGMRRSAWALVIVAPLVTFSCILADPPADLPKYPPIRPTVVKGSVLPPTDKIVLPPLPTFVVPVELVDQNATFAWSVFVDFDPVTNPLPVAGDIVEPDPATIDGGVRAVSFSITDVPSSTRCHTIEFLVARSFNSASPHTPNAPGGDSVSWFYNPSGSIDGCPTYDAGGFDASSVVDASVDSASTFDAAGQ